MTKSRQATKSALIIVFFTFGSKLIGFIREMLIASKFGSSMETDSYFIAITATGLIIGLISNAISTTFIPVITEVEAKEGKIGKIEHTNNMINVVFIISIILLIIGWIASPIIVRIVARGFVGEQFDLTVKLNRIAMPMILFSGIVGVLTGFLHSENKFATSSALGFPRNLVYIVFLLFFSSKFGIVGLMVASTIAVASQVIILIPDAIKSGFKYKLIFDFKDVYVKRILILSVPVLISVAINDLNAIVDRTLASSLEVGSISALNYANRLINLILGVFITAVTTVIFPLLSKESNDGNIDNLKIVMGRGINIIMIMIIPASVGMIALAKPIIEIAFERGSFDVIATQMSSQALMFYSIGLLGMSVTLLLNRVYYSLQDTKAPMVNGAISVGFNIILSLILVKFMAHSGLALATSIATTIATILLLYGLKKKIGSLGTKGYITTFLKTGLASGVMGVVAYLIYHGLYRMLGVSKLYNLISLLMAVGAGVVVYLILCYVFKVEEVGNVVGKVKRRLKR
ncbi:murein biosynthesis integral membrane protein MurJ [Proteiniborus sp.]|uniref:murein biosynthesis integral membrane protein MurJ n=1 Tax=Proteiniborus sp. TaxID=2079015 RepID=UPI00332CD637